MKRGVDMISKSESLNLNILSEIAADVNNKMQDIDGLSQVPCVWLEVVTYEGRAFYRIMFLDRELWSSDEGPHSVKEIKELIAEEILSLTDNLNLMASAIRKHIDKQTW